MIKIGELLLQVGKITMKQLYTALSYQSLHGGFLGEILTLKGWINDTQLKSALDFQTNGQVKIGQLLIASGHLTEEQLSEVLDQQAQTNKKIGELLIENGFVSEHKMEHFLSVQTLLVTTLLSTVLSCSSVNASTVKLQWDPNSESDLAGYTVYYAPYTSNSLVSGTTVDIKAPITVASISGLDPYSAYQFAVTAYNTSGIESEFSNIVTVQAAPVPVDTVAPTTTIVAPANGITVRGVVQVNVIATDNVSISKVELYEGTTLVGATNVAPYSFSFNTVGLSEGTHTLIVKAHDLSSNVGQSFITVYVNNIDRTPGSISGIRMVSL